MTKKLPHSNEIENSAKVIRATEFLYLASFADMINRYVDIMFKKDIVNRLRFGALSLLIVRGGSLTPTRLARLMFRSKHSITKVIDSLEKDGFVIRDRTSEDRRTILVKVTSAGLDFVVRALREGDKNTREVVSCLDKDELRTLINLIQRMRRTMIEKISSQ